MKDAANTPSEHPVSASVRHGVTGFVNDRENEREHKRTTALQNILATHALLEKLMAFCAFSAIFVESVMAAFCYNHWEFLTFLNQSALGTVAGALSGYGYATARHLRKNPPPTSADSPQNQTLT